MTIDILVVVSRAESQPVLVPLLGALHRAGCRFALFFTHSGTTLASQADIVRLAAVADAAVVCQESWAHWRSDAGAPCLLQSGSQTDHSQLIGRSDRVVSL